MKTLSLIMAAGKRNGDFIRPKVLLPIGGESLLQRNVTLAQKYFGKPVEVMVSNVQLGEEISCGVILTNRTLGCCDTLMDTVAFWNGYDRVQVLLADVFFSAASLEQMASETRSIVFFCDTQETFALQFRRKAYPIIAKAGAEVVRMAHGRDKGAGFPHLWQYLSTEKHRPVKAQLGPPTQDFDSVKDYTNFLKGKTKNKPLE